MKLDSVFKSGLEVIEFENDGKTERIKALTHTWKANEFFFLVSKPRSEFSE
jgi:hypothetical protein